MVYAACENSNIISFNETSGAVRTLTDSTQCNTPMMVGLHPTNGLLYATCFYSGVISINPITGVVTELLNAVTGFCTQPFGVSFNISSGSLIVACKIALGSGIVISVDPTTAATTILVNAPGICNYPISAIFNVNDGLVYAACTAGTVVSVNPNAQNPSAVTVVIPSSTCSWPRVLSMNTVLNTIDVPCSFAGNPVSVLSIKGGSGLVSTLATSSQCAAAYWMDSSATDGTVFAACGNGVFIFDADGNSQTIVSSSCTNLRAVTYDDNTGNLYASCGPNGPIMILTPVTPPATTTTANTNAPTTALLF
jgi:hypothetical protein